MSELTLRLSPDPAWKPGEDSDENVPVVRNETDDRACSWLSRRDALR
jgi:hypothetical protein